MVVCVDCLLAAMGRDVRCRRHAEALVRCRVHVRVCTHARWRRIFTYMKLATRRASVYCNGYFPGSYTYILDF